MFNLFYLFFLILAQLLTVIKADGLIDPFDIKIFHKLNLYHDYIPRGTIKVTQNKNINANFIPISPLNDKELNDLKTLCKEDKEYFIKATSLNKNKEEVKSSETFIKACSLINSNLKENLVIYLDFNGSFLSLSSYHNYSSSSESTNVLNQNQFETHVYVVQTTSTPVPDTQTYIQRLEFERQEKIKGETADNRSFLAKYWIYILPLSIFYLISSASNQEQPANQE